MKHTILTFISLFIVLGVCHSQNGNDMVAQPTHVVGRCFNADGEITRELVSDFSYLEDGKLFRYAFPGYLITTTYTYDGDYITEERINHAGGYPEYNEINQFTYENGLIKTITHLQDQMGYCRYVLYTYYDDGRLEKEEQKDEGDSDYRRHWIYEYPGDGRTVIQSYYTSYPAQGTILWKKSTSQYDEQYRLSSVLVEKYDEAGETTSTSQTGYTYTDGGQLEKTVTQSLDNGTWVNASITQYAYDGERLVEKLDGSWDGETGEWNFSRKITFDYANDGLTYRVSFHKKSGGNWVWDVFNNQTVLFGDIFKAQQRMLGYMAYDDMFGHGDVNQIEFSMEWTKQPEYLDTEEKAALQVSAFPNPVTDELYLQCSPDARIARVELYDMEGRLVVSEHGGTDRIGMEGLAPGIYAIRVTLGDGTSFTDKVVKQ